MTESSAEKLKLTESTSTCPTTTPTAKSTSTSASPFLTTTTTTISAPGKALIAGGYLVLESPNPGLVLATDSCFHVTITTKPMHCLDLPLNVNDNVKEGESDDNDNDKDNEFISFPLDVYSPQFHAIFTYNVIMKKHISSKSSSSLISLQPRYINQQSNSYIEKTIIATLSTILIQEMKSTKSTNSSHDNNKDTFLKLSSLLSSSSSSSSSLSSNDKNKNQALAIKLRADNDFYSIIPHLKEFKLNPIPSDIQKLPSFLPCPKKKVIVEDKNDDTHDGEEVKEGEEKGEKGSRNKKRKIEKEKVIVEVNKTGLGSSAALVTSLVGALLVHFNVVNIPNSNTDTSDSTDTNTDNTDTSINTSSNAKMTLDNINKNDNGLKIIHNLAQICHSFAQGKIGSGFDVSAAVHGSHIYTRFDKSIITSIMDQLSNDLSNSTDSTGSSSIQFGTGEALWDCVCDLEKWNALVEPLTLPHGVQVLMADICGGSESPSMAKKVLAWKKKKEQEQNQGEDSKGGATEWLELVKINTSLKKLFQKASKDNDAAKTESLLKQFRDSILDSRKYLKAMGNAAGVPIEPDEQTKLADDTMDIPGVIAAGIPGAGGYDALFVLYKGDGKDKDEVRDRIGQFWMDWCQEQKQNGNRGVVCPLASRCVGYGQGLSYSKLKW